MAASNTVSITNGVNTYSSPEIAGLTVQDVMDGSYGTVLALNGDEVFNVASGGSDDYRNVNASYTLQLGDSLRFDRSGGTKGSN